MKHRIVIEYETPDDSIHDKNFSAFIAEKIARKAVGDYLFERENMRRNALDALYKITSSTNESRIEK